jgi:hypothetical protein
MIDSAGKDGKKQPIAKPKFCPLQQIITHFHLKIVPVQVEQTAGHNGKNEIERNTQVII